MSYFPASSSVLSAAHLVPFLKTTYGLGEDVYCRIIKAGVNHTYMVRDDERQYIFRVYSAGWRTDEEVSEEIRLIDHLRHNDVPVSYAVADAGGQYIQQIDAIEGRRQGVLFSYADGEKVMNPAGEMHERIGGVMADIHKHTQDYRLNRVTYTPEVLLETPFMALRPFIAADTEEMKFMTAAKDHLLAELGRVDTSMLRHGAVHLDMWFDNLNIDKKGAVTIFDFDFCGNGWLCYDVAYYLLQLFTVEPDTKIFAEKRSSFLRGNQEVMPLSDEELRILPMLGTVLYFFYLGVQCSRFDDWSNVFINETYLKRFIEVRVKRYYDFNSK